MKTNETEEPVTKFFFHFDINLKIFLLSLTFVTIEKANTACIKFINSPFRTLLFFFVIFNNLNSRLINNIKKKIYS